MEQEPPLLQLEQPEEPDALSGISGSTVKPK